jgi:triacylglycerol lipase
MPPSILLIHGIFRQSSVFCKLKNHLTELGYTVYSPDLLHRYGALGLLEVAQQVADYVERKFAPEESFDLVGLSMGGLVSRYYVQRLGGIDRIENFVTVSSPHRGTWMAYTFPRTTGLQMRPGSQFLNDLNSDLQMLERIKFTSIWTPLDFVIVPPTSSQMPLGNNVKLSVFLHAMMVRDDRSIQAICDALVGN